MKSARPINENQLRLYRIEWNKARRVLRRTLSPTEADARRHAMHVEALGEDKSSTAFTNKDLDEVLKRFRAISKPADFTGQIALDDQEAKRGRYRVTRLRGALGKTEDDVEAMIERRREAGRLVTVQGAAAASFETIGPADLERLALDLKAECRKRWPRQGDLHNELRLLRMEFPFDEETTAAEVARVLKVTTLPAMESMDYDELLKVIATMRKIASAEVPF